MVWMSLWWLWLCAALALGISEVMLPGFIFLGFAIGALAMTLFFGVSGMVLTPPVTLLAFAAVSLIAWLGLRHFFAAPGGGQVKTFDRDIND